MTKYKRMASPSPRTLFDKIWSAHCIAELSGDTALIAIDRVFLHERTGSVALKSLADARRPIAMARQTFVTMDHIVDTRPGRTDATPMPGGEAFITQTRSAARAAGLTLFDIGDERQGIVHVVSPEQGIVLPGLTLVCPDSHSCTQGAFGALAWGIGSTEAEHALATRTLRVRRPRAMRIAISGQLAAGVTPKDLALTLIARHGAAGGNGYVVEYAGSAVRALDMAGRMTLCNMATEFSAFTGLIAPDDVTTAFLHGRPYAPAGALWDEAVRQWRTLASDDEAVFDAQLAIDANDVAPMVTWGTSPEQAVSIDARVPAFEALAPGSAREAYDRALAYMDMTPGAALAGLPIDAAFIGSCTNARLPDLRRAAALIKGRTVAQGVTAIVVPGSTAVKRAAEAEGLDRLFSEAGFQWRESGCSMCFYAGGESFGARQRVISSTNRNFESRQGPHTRTHLASPETVAASALAGCIADPRRFA